MAQSNFFQHPAPLIKHTWAICGPVMTACTEVSLYIISTKKKKGKLTWHIDTSNRSKCPEVSALMSCSMSRPNSDL